MLTQGFIGISIQYLKNFKIVIISISPYNKIKLFSLTLSSTNNVVGKFSAINRKISSFWLSTAICKLHRLRSFFAIANMTHSSSRSCNISSTWSWAPKKISRCNRFRFSLISYFVSNQPKWLILFSSYYNYIVVYYFTNFKSRYTLKDSW